MKNLEQLNTERSQYQTELQELELKVAQWEADLEDSDYAETFAGQSLKIPLQEARSKVNNVEHKISVIDQNIAWFDRKANSFELMATYKETMSNWATDKADLEAKRKALNTRLEEIKI